MHALIPYLWRILLAALLTALYVSTPADDSGIELNSDNTVANAGFYTLSWQSDRVQQQGYILQESGNIGFKHPVTLYTGLDTAYALSGKSNGKYFYRLSAISPESRGETRKYSWSKPVMVTVAHHSKLRAFGFFTAGAIIFIATLLLIVIGVRQTRNKDTYD